MRHSILVPLLVLGTIGGYGAGFASMACHSREHRAAFERHVADVCVAAARRDGDRGRRDSDADRDRRDSDRDRDRRGTDRRDRDQADRDDRVGE